MKAFKGFIETVNGTFGSLLFGTSVAELFFNKDYKAASYMMFIVAILFIIGFYTERFVE